MHVCVNICHVYVDTPGGQKRVLGPLKLIVSGREPSDVGVGKQTQVLWKSSKHS